MASGRATIGRYREYVGELPKSSSVINAKDRLCRVLMLPFYSISDNNSKFDLALGQILKIFCLGSFDLLLPQVTDCYFKMYL